MEALSDTQAVMFAGSSPPDISMNDVYLVTLSSSPQGSLLVTYTPVKLGSHTSSLPPPRTAFGMLAVNGWTRRQHRSADGDVQDDEEDEDEDVCREVLIFGGSMNSLLFRHPTAGVDLHSWIMKVSLAATAADLTITRPDLWTSMLPAASSPAGLALTVAGGDGCKHAQLFATREAPRLHLDLRRLLRTRIGTLLFDFSLQCLPAADDGYGGMVSATGCETDVLRCHRLLLGCRSPYFRSLLEGGEYTEAKTRYVVRHEDMKA